MLTTASVIPTVEAVAFSSGDIHPQICHRSRVYTKLNRHDDDYGHR